MSLTVRVHDSAKALSKDVQSHRVLHIVLFLLFTFTARIYTYIISEYTYNYLRREGTKTSLRKKTSLWLWGEFDSALELRSRMGK